MQKAIAVPSVLPFTYGWLRNRSFDAFFIGGIALLAVLTGWIATQNPKMFPLILFLDLWILGYHHVVATYTRLAFDVESFQKNKFLVVGLPWIIVFGTVGGVMILGPWILATTYLYWQWFHYTRQSYGIVRGYARKGAQGNNKSDLLEQLTVYVVPIWGIMRRSYQSPSKFLGMDLKVIPTPEWVVHFLAAVSAVVVVCWAIRQIINFFKGRLQLGYTLYMISHLVVFWVGYIVIKDVNYGWLCLNVWHNAQYVMFVWMFNNNRFKNGIDPNHRFLSMLSQRKNIVLYYAACLIISTIIYMFIFKASRMITITAFPLVVVAYQVMNFHHYVVDAIIWKFRRKQPATNRNKWCRFS